MLVSEDESKELLNKEPALRIDTRGLCCPYPSFETVKSMSKIKDGEVLEVITDSEESAKDSIPNVCNRRGWRFVVIEEADNLWKLRITK